MSSFPGTSRTCSETTSRRYKTERPSTDVVLVFSVSTSNLYHHKGNPKISSDLKQVESSLQNPKMIRLALEVAEKRTFRFLSFQIRG